MVSGRKPAFFSRGPMRVLRYLKNDIDIESIISLSRGGHSAEDDHDDDHDTDSDDDDDDESSGDEYDLDKATDHEGSQDEDNDFFYFLFIDSHLNG